MFAIGWLTPLLLWAQGASVPPAIQQYLKHPGFEWKCEAGAHFQFCWEAGMESDPNLAAARNSAEAARNRVLQFAGASAYAPRIHVFFVASTDRMQQLIGYHGEGRSRPVQHAVFFVPTPIRPDLTHELAHEILTNLWGAAEAWIEEGMAALLAEPFAVRDSCLSLAVRHALIPLPELVNAHWNPTVYSPDVTYMELGGFLAFLRAGYGPEKVKQIWRGGSTSIPHVLGESLNSVEKAWRAALDREVALRFTPQ